MNANANSSLVSPRPPNSSGIDQPNVPSRRISSTMSWGTWSPASTRSSFGIATSLTKRRVAAKSSSIAAWSRIIVAFLNLIRLLKRTTPCERPSIQQAIMLQPDIYLYPSAIQRSFHPSPHEATRSGSGSDPRRVALPRRRRPALLAVTRRERDHFTRALTRLLGQGAAATRDESRPRGGAGQRCWPLRVVSEIISPEPSRGYSARERQRPATSRAPAEAQASSAGRYAS